MTLTTFVLVRGARGFDYPLREVCRSIYALTEELLLLVHPEEDGTEEWVQEIRQEFPATRVLAIPWWDGRGCLERAVNHCIEQVATTHYFWLPADEALHEREVSQLRGEMDRGVDLVTVGHVHFWAGFQRTFTRGTTCHWAPMLGKRSRYPQLRCANEGADGLGLPDGSVYPFEHVNLAGQVKLYHYGYVRTPEALVRKNRSLRTVIGLDDDTRWEQVPRWEDLLPETATSLFGGTHPGVMKTWIAEREQFFRECYQ